MRKSIIRGSVLIAALLLAACTSVGESASAKENLLSTAGFKTVPANELKELGVDSLPSGHIVKIKRGDVDVFLYQDANACACLLKGDEQAFQRYKSEKLERDFHPAGAVPAAF
jgi:hypothetical protein